MPRYLDKDTRDRIIELFKEGKSFNAIGKELGIAASTASNIVKKELPMEERMPELPATFDSVELAYSVCTACKSAGYDSPITEMMCSQFNVDVKKIRELANWFANNCSVNTYESINELRSEVETRDRLIEGLSADRVESEEALEYLAQAHLKKQLKNTTKKLQKRLEQEKNKVRFLEKVHEIMNDRSGQPK